MASRVPEEAMTMKCAICKTGMTAAGLVTVTLERGESTIVFKGVPAQVCENCGEQYVDERVTSDLLQQAQAAVGSGVQVEVRSFAA